MDSLRNLYKIGNGPSSSHTMGPQIASSRFKEKNPNATKYSVELFGSLALTGKGHLTDYIIKKTLGENKTEVLFNLDQVYSYHTNGMKFRAYINDDLLDEWLVFSVGGGALKELNEPRDTGTIDIYPHKNMKDILAYCEEEKIDFVTYVQRFDKDIYEYLEKIYHSMHETIKRGLAADGVLPGRLQVKRRSKSFYQAYLNSPNKSFPKLLFSYALATAEENASAGVIVTSPTCGSSGVLPAILFVAKDYHHHKKDTIIKALMVAGLIGNVIKFNGSISGAEVGCQGEIGVACAMASAAEAFLLKGNNKQIEYAAEIALEHHLGLTCDPVDGVVQIPCIERNAIASAKAFDAANYALLTDGDHYISLDDVVKVMMETGLDLHSKYKETSTGGLASNKK